MTRSFGVRPQFLIVAGPNGAGKSTLAKGGLASHDTPQGSLKIRVLDPDKIAARFLIKPGQTKDIRAMRAVHAALDNALTEGASIGVETAALTQAHYRFATRAKASGFAFAFVFVYLANVELHIERVAQRVRLGGHNIRETDIRRRFQSAIENFPAFAAMADRVAVFDNSWVGAPTLSVQKSATGWRLYPEIAGAPDKLRRAIETLAAI